MEEISFISPTYKRANKVEATALFGDMLILACHESEEAEYRKAYPNNKLLVIPDTERGNMGKVRNFILNNSPTKRLVMLDDDVSKIGYHEGGKQIFMELTEILQFIENGFNIAEEVGTCLWGINLQSDPRFYREYDPICFDNVVLGPFSCHIIDDKLRYDERLGLNEDYDYAIQVARKYRKILRFNKFFYNCSHLTQKGGCSVYRVLDNERRQAEIMIRKWGSKIVKYNFNKSTNPIVKLPI